MQSNDVFFDISAVPATLRHWHRIEELCFSPTKENIVRLEKIYQNLPNDTKKSFSLMLSRACKVRPLQRKRIEHFLAKLNSNCGENDHEQKPNHSKVATPSISHNDESFYGKSTLVKCIENDQLQHFISRTAAIDLNSNVSFEGKQFSLISFASFCGSIDIFKYLLTNNAKVTRDTLECALKGGKEEIVEILSQQHSFNNCLSVAIRYHMNTLCKWLIENYTSNNEAINLRTCIESWNTIAFSYFIRHQDVDYSKDCHSSPIGVATLVGNIEYVKYLLDIGFNVNETDARGNTPALVAIKNNQTDILRTLIKSGAEIEKKDKFGFTPLLKAAHWGKYEPLKILVANGAKIDAVDRYGWSSLLYACAGGFKDIVQFLIKAGASTDTKNTYGQTAMSVAKNEEIINLLSSNV